eukprot:6321249-Amphidinium_carterae.2
MRSLNALRTLLFCSQNSGQKSFKWFLKGFICILATSSEAAIGLVDEKGYLRPEYEAALEAAAMRHEATCHIARTHAQIYDDDDGKEPHCTTSKCLRSAFNIRVALTVLRQELPKGID